MARTDLLRASLKGLAFALALTAPLAARAAPDISGYWNLDRTSVGYGGGRNTTIPPGLLRPWLMLSGYGTNGNEPPPLRPEIVAQIRALHEKELAGAVADEGTLKCLSPNNFDMMTWGDPLDILQRQDAVVVVPEKERSIPRHIFLDAQHPAGLEPSVNGHSVGHWEGDTLVVDTIKVDPSQPLLFGDYIPLSAGLHVTERMTLEPGGKNLTVVWSFDDPAVFTKAWKVTVRFVRAPPDTEAIEAVCDVNARVR